MARKQYEAAKHDIEYFMRLVDLASWFHKEEEEKATQGEAVQY